MSATFTVKGGWLEEKNPFEEPTLNDAIFRDSVPEAREKVDAYNSFQPRRVLNTLNLPDGEVVEGKDFVVGWQVRHHPFGWSDCAESVYTQLTETSRRLVALPVEKKEIIKPTYMDVGEIARGLEEIKRMTTTLGESPAVSLQHIYKKADELRGKIRPVPNEAYIQELSLVLYRAAKKLEKIGGHEDLLKQINYILRKNFNPLAVLR